MRRATESNITIYTGKHFDFSVLSDFIKEVSENFDANKKITIDFSKTDYLDSSDIDSLVNIHKTLPYQKPKIKLANLPDDVSSQMLKHSLDKYYDL